MERKTDELLRRIRASLDTWSPHIEEKRMFGGTCFLYKGKMCVGETKGRLMVRVIDSKMEHVMKNPNVKPMDFTGKPMKEFIFVLDQGYTDEEKLQYWIELGIEHATLNSL